MFAISGEFDLEANTCSFEQQYEEIDARVEFKGSMKSGTRIEGTYNMQGNEADKLQRSLGLPSNAKFVAQKRPKDD